MAGKRGTERRGRVVGQSPPAATEPRRAQSGPVRTHRVQMIDSLAAIEPTHDHHMVPGKGWVPDSEE